MYSTYISKSSRVNLKQLFIYNIGGWGDWIKQIVKLGKLAQVLE